MSNNTEIVAMELTKLILQGKANNTKMNIEFNTDPKKFVLEIYLDCLRVVDNPTIEKP